MILAIIIFVSIMYLALVLTLLVVSYWNDKRREKLNKLSLVLRDCDLSKDQINNFFDLVF